MFFPICVYIEEVISILYEHILSYCSSIVLTPYYDITNAWLYAVFRIRILIRLDPFHFGNPDLFNETDPGSKKSVKIMENFHRNQPKSQEYLYILQKYLILFNGHNYLTHE